MVQEELTSSLEDYLEAIHELISEKGKAGITDISYRLNVKKSSVNSAVKRLKVLDLVIHEKYEDIVLTEKGAAEAERVRAKHDVLLKFLVRVLKVPKKEAKTEACKIEHVISNGTFKRLRKFMDELEH